MAVDSVLAKHSGAVAVKEILSGCICCNVVGTLQAAIEELVASYSPGSLIPFVIFSTSSRRIHTDFRSDLLGDKRKCFPGTIGLGGSSSAERWCRYSFRCHCLCYRLPQLLRLRGYILHCQSAGEVHRPNPRMLESITMYTCPHSGCEQLNKHELATPQQLEKVVDQVGIVD